MFIWSLRIFLSLAVLAVLLNWVGFGSFAQALISLDGGSLAFMFILTVFSVVVRGWRAKIVQEASIAAPSLDYVMIAIFHNVANQVMPFRSGEIAFPILIKRYLGHQISRSTASLLFIRFVEVMVLGGLVVIGVSFVLGGEGQLWLFFVPIFLFLAWLVWFFLARLLLAGHRFLLSVGGKGRWGSLLLRLAHALSAIATELGKKKATSVHLLVFGLTIVNWLMLIGVCWVVLLSLGVQVNFAETIVGSSVASMAQFIPLGSIGNIGPMEAGWTLGFVMVGMDAKVAMNAGVVLHLVMILSSIILAGLAWLAMKGRNFGVE